MKKGIRTSLVTFAWIWVIVPSVVKAQQTPQTFIEETKYLLALPDGYNLDTLTRWPLLVFLHGSGESGTDLEKVKMHGPPKLIAAGKKFPFIVISPQAKRPSGWEPENLYNLISSIKQNYRVDPSRIYLTGLSMGGFGTWALAMKHPEEFAAIVPICGGADTTDAWKLRHTPVWCFHGALDDVVLPIRDQVMVDAVRKYNREVRFTIYPDANHNSWDRTYDNDSMYQWLLAQRKFTYKQVQLSPSALKAYTGRYVNTDKDTVIIELEKNELKARLTKRTFPLKPAGDDTFFIGEQIPVDIHFLRDKKGKTNSFIVYEERRVLFRKI